MSYIAKNGRLYTSGASEALTLLDDKFSVNKSYSKGDSCIYNDYLWKFTSDKPAGEWNPSVVEQCRIMDFVDDINGRLTQGVGKYSTGDPNLLLELGEMSRNRTFANANLRIICKVTLPANNTYGLGTVYPRPKYRVPLVIICSNGTSHIGEIATNGTIYIAVSSVTPANGSFSFNANYLANEEDTVLY